MEEEEYLEKYLEGQMPSQEYLENREALRCAVRALYDYQKMRIAAGNRVGSKEAALSEKQKQSLSVQGWMLEKLESEALKGVKSELKKFKIYNDWLKDQKGVGPAMAGVILSSIDIYRAQTPSAIFMYCGLGVVDGKIQKRVKGEKLGYNPWVKSKLLKVMGDCMIKSNSPWRDFYDNYKTRKKNTIVPVCGACKGDGKFGKDDCKNCGGSGKDAPWGKSDAHRHQASIRYMVKMFLVELYNQWREVEGLPVAPTYQEAYLNIKHGEHGTPGFLGQ